MSQLISVKEFAERYSVSRATVYRLRDRGEIVFWKVGRAVRIKTEDAEKWFTGLQESTSGAG